MNHRRSKVVRRSAGLLALALAASLPVVANNAGAVATVKTERIGGVNRYDTARLIAAATFTPPVSNILLANGLNWPDALAGNALAGAVDGPLLTTNPDALSAETAAAITSLKKADGTTKVHILGGTTAVGQAVRDAVEDLGVVIITDYNGANRYETAALIATAVDKTGPIGTTFAGSRTAFLTTGGDFPDALAAGPLAYVGANPVLLAPAAFQLENDPTLKIIDDLNIDSIIILGGTNAVTPAVETRLKAEIGPDKVVRLAGANRYDTANLIADIAITQYAFEGSTVLLARGDGDNFADALAAGPHGGVVKAPILLTGSTLNASTATWLREHDHVVDTIRDRWRERHQRRDACRR